MFATPLDHILLNLASQFDNEMKRRGDDENEDTETRVRQVLLKVIDPPASNNVNKAFESLHERSFMNESGPTEIGLVASSLGIDLNLAQLIIFGTMLKVAPECVAISAALSLTNLPFRRASHFVHSSAEIGEICRTVHNGFKYFGSDVMASTPMVLLRVLMWAREKKRSNSEFHTHGLVPYRVRLMERNCAHLRSRIEQCRVPAMRCAVFEKHLRDPLYDQSVQTRLRVAIMWTFHSNRLSSKPKLGCSVAHLEHIDLVLNPEDSSKVCSDTSKVMKMLCLEEKDCTGVVLPMSYVTYHVKTSTGENVDDEELRKKLKDVTDALVWIKDHIRVDVNSKARVFANEILESFEVVESNLLFASECAKDERREIKTFLRTCREGRVSFVRVIVSDNNNYRMNVYGMNQRGVESILRKVFSTVRFTTGPTDRDVVVRFPLLDDAAEVFLQDLPFALRRTLSIASRRRCNVRGSIGIIFEEDENSSSKNKLKNKYHVRLQCPDMFHNSVLTSQMARQVKISFESPYAHSVDFKNGGRVSSVASSVLFVGENGSMAIVSNLTIMPDEKWIHCALQCVYHSATSSFSDEGSSEEDDDILQEDIRIIRRELHLGNLEQGPDIIDNAVRILFEERGGVVVIDLKKKKNEKKNRGGRSGKKKKNKTK